MLQIQDPEIEQLLHKQPKDRNMLKRLSQQPILDLPFRSFFLLATVCSVYALTIWLAYLNGHFLFEVSGLSGPIWHIHEMVFGFAATVAVGFILTAVQTWTGQASIKGYPVLVLVVLWLLVRACLFINLPVFIYHAVLLQTLWWLYCIYIFSKLVITTKNRRNIPFIPLLTMLMVMNIGLIIGELLGYRALSLHLARTAILLFSILVSLLAARVIPFFTISGAQVNKIEQPKWLTLLITGLSILGTVVFFIGYFIDMPFTPAVFMISVGSLHLIRLSFWKTTATFSIPLLWSLHIAYAFLAFGMLLLGLSYLPTEYKIINFSEALHVITIGTMGLMIFAMMSRVSLGHTGRALKPRPLISWVFTMLVLSVLARALLPTFNQYELAWNISGILWIFAGIIFFKEYMSILSSPSVKPSFQRKNEDR